MGFDGIEKKRDLGIKIEGLCSELVKQVLDIARVLRSGFVAVAISEDGKERRD